MAGELPSKTQRKKQMLELQDLGVDLVALDDDQLMAMALPENLHDAVLEARRITRFEARRRQLQYIGKLMRTIDPGPIRARIDAWKIRSREHTARLHLIERWRERLLADEAALGELAASYPNTDAQQMRALVRNAQRERRLDAPPKSYRALFQALREIISNE